jgi:large subunit ribosomal protein L1
MQDIGRYLGTVLGPRGKMPTPLQPDDDVVETVNRMKNTVQLRSRDRRTFHTRVGAEDMTADEIAENIDVIVRRLEANLEKGPLNIDGIYVKTTMGPSVEVRA